MHHGRRNVVCVVDDNPAVACLTAAEPPHRQRATATSADGTRETCGWVHLRYLCGRHQCWGTCTCGVDSEEWDGRCSTVTLPRVAGAPMAGESDDARRAHLRYATSPAPSQSCRAQRTRARDADARQRGLTMGRRRVDQRTGAAAAPSTTTPRAVAPAIDVACNRL